MARSTSRRGINSVVECQLPKLKVGGSNPLSRSIQEFTHSVFCIILYSYSPDWLGKMSLDPTNRMEDLRERLVVLRRHL